MPPLTSWIIRTKNEAEHIEEVLVSLQQQTRQDFEIIVVDSGSSDGTVKIVKKYPIKLIKIKPEEFNYSYALNLGIQKARGKYIGILSGHCVPWKKTFYEEAVKFFDNPKVAGVSGFPIEGPGFVVHGALQLHQVVFKTWHYWPWMTNTNSLIRRDLWMKYPFDEQLLKGCEDYDWGTEMIARGFEVIKTPKFSVRYFRDKNKPSLLKMLKVWHPTRLEIELKDRPSESYTSLSLDLGYGQIKEENVN